MSASRSPQEAAPGLIRFRSSGFGGYQFTRALVREFQLTAAQAEALKRDPATTDSLSRMYNALEPAFEALVEEIQSWLERHAGRGQEWPVGRVIGCGGGFQLHGLLRYLRTGGGLRPSREASD